ncbi:hypothetical protein VNO77_18809 [Canavalia gladiata]|uniref:FLZ-type domain-containing protein n=1 Tax=Canavalia gladiata TaxID=3824 RepID=A0AAN9QJZ1_CANGL
MFGKLKSPFKVECKERKSSEVSSIESSGLEVGLRLLIQITNSKGTSNVIVQSALRKVNQTSPLHCCFLQTCNLCNKQLSPDKDIYMYRGDEGFCSAECRNRQIVLDEMREEEKCGRRQMAASYRHCWNYGTHHETRLILEDLRRPRLHSNQTPPNQNHWAIVS